MSLKIANFRLKVKCKSSTFEKNISVSLWNSNVFVWIPMPPIVPRKFATLLNFRQSKWLAPDGFSVLLLGFNKLLKSNFYEELLRVDTSAWQQNVYKNNSKSRILRIGTRCAIFDYDSNWLFYNHWPPVVSWLKLRIAFYFSPSFRHP